MSITMKQLEQLKGAVANRVPYISGVVPLPPQSTTLFFSRGGTIGQLDLGTPEDAQVQLLAKLCEPATFGRNQEDLLDETYRKAGKMNIENFAMSIDLGQLQIPNKISSELLVDGRPFRWELHKLNVYGPGSFFKAHKDTPRSEAMFGSLVLVLPISHKGGELLLRTKEEVWTYDSTATLALQNGHLWATLPSVISNMKSFRLNLATGSPSHTTSSSLQSHPPWFRLQHLRSELLGRWWIGGLGLKYEYPVSMATRRKHDALESVSENLKGEDALVARISASLGLKADIKVYIDLKEMWERDYTARDFDDETWVDGLGLLMNYLLSLASIGDSRVYYHLRGNYRHDEVLRANKADTNDKAVRLKTVGQKRPEVWWLSEPTHACAEVPFASFGNEPQLDFIYGNFCLIIDIPPYATRKSGEAWHLLL